MNIRNVIFIGALFLIVGLVVGVGAVNTGYFGLADAPLLKKLVDIKPISENKENVELNDKQPETKNESSDILQVGNIFVVSENCNLELEGVTSGMESATFTLWDSEENVNSNYLHFEVIKNNFIIDDLEECSLEGKYPYLDEINNWGTTNNSDYRVEVIFKQKLGPLQSLGNEVSTNLSTNLEYLNTYYEDLFAELPKVYTKKLQGQLDSLNEDEISESVYSSLTFPLKQDRETFSNDGITFPNINIYEKIKINFDPFFNVGRGDLIGTIPVEGLKYSSEIGTTNVLMPGFDAITEGHNRAYVFFLGEKYEVLMVSPNYGTNDNPNIHITLAKEKRLNTYEIGNRIENLKGFDNETYYITVDTVGNEHPEDEYSVVLSLYNSSNERIITEEMVAEGEVFASEILKTPIAVRKISNYGTIDQPDYHVMLLNLNGFLKLENHYSRYSDWDVRIETSSAGGVWTIAMYNNVPIELYNRMSCLTEACENGKKTVRFLEGNVNIQNPLNENYFRLRFEGFEKVDNYKNISFKKDKMKIVDQDDSIIILDFYMKFDVSQLNEGTFKMFDNEAANYLVMSLNEEELYNYELDRENNEFILEHNGVTISYSYQDNDIDDSRLIEFRDRDNIRHYYSLYVNESENEVYLLYSYSKDVTGFKFTEVLAFNSGKGNVYTVPIESFATAHLFFYEKLGYDKKGILEITLDDIREVFGETVAYQKGKISTIEQELVWYYNDALELKAYTDGGILVKKENDNLFLDMPSRPLDVKLAVEMGHDFGFN
jgi:hypothetical protein